MRFAIVPLLLAVAGCVPGPGLGGGSPTGDMGHEGGLAPATAPWALVDLASGAITWRVAVADLATNAAYRDQTMVFRRAGSGSAECLVAAFELTQAQWRRLSGDASGAEPWATVAETVVPTSAHGDDRPAFNLAYDEIAIVLATVRLADGGRLAVPTAAQWEAAAGGSSGWAWGGSGSPARLRATSWVRDTADGQAGQRPVGRGEATGAGFYDLHGNVWEWTAPGATVRGGSWADDASACRIEQAAGPGLTAALDHALIGVRLVLQP